MDTLGSRKVVTMCNREKDLDVYATSKELLEKWREAAKASVPEIFRKKSDHPKPQVPNVLEPTEDMQVE